MNKKAFSVLIIFIFIAAAFNTSFVSSSSIKEDDSCICQKSDSDDKINFCELSFSEKKGLISMAILYKRFELEICHFDSLEDGEKYNYLNSIVSTKQLFELYGVIDEALKEKIISIKDLFDGKESILNQKEDDSDIRPTPIDGQKRFYDPYECTKLLKVPIKNFYNNIINPALNILGYSITQINFTNLERVVINIINIIPRPGLLLISKVFKTIYKLGIYWLDNVKPVLEFIKSNPVTSLSKGFRVLTFTLWSSIVFVHIYCKFHLCGSENNDPSRKSHSFNIQNVLNDFKNNLFRKTKFDLVSKIFLLFSKKVKSRNINEKIMQSLDENSPPEIEVLNGPSYRTIPNNTPQTFFVKATDPNNDRITYYFDWGDGTEDFIENVRSGKGKNFEHIWINPGLYTVNVTVYDEYDLESEPEIRNYEVYEKPDGNSKLL